MAVLLGMLASSTGGVMAPHLPRASFAGAVSASEVVSGGALFLPLALDDEQQHFTDSEVPMHFLYRNEL